MSLEQRSHSLLTLQAASAAPSSSTFSNLLDRLADVVTSSRPECGQPEARMSFAVAPSLSPTRRKHAALAASNKRKRSAHLQPQRHRHTPQVHDTTQSLFVRGRSAHPAQTTAPSSQPAATQRSPHSATTTAETTTAIDSQTNHLIDLPSFHHTRPPRPGATSPLSHSPMTEPSHPPSPPRAGSPPHATPIPPLSPRSTHPLPPAQSSPVAHLQAARPASPPPAVSSSPPAACLHTVSATSPSAPKSTIASYIHRFRTQPPLDEHERQKRLQQHHELPHRDFWWLRRHGTDGREGSRQEEEDGRGEDDEQTETAKRPVNGGRGRLSILPAIEAVLSEEERRVTAELARWSRPRQPPSESLAQPPSDTTAPLRVAPFPAQPPSSVPSPQPQTAIESLLAPPVPTTSSAPLLSTDAATAASSSVQQPPPQQASFAQHAQYPFSSAAVTQATPLSSGASLTHRDNILRLARELRLPGLSSIAAHDLPAALPASQPSDQWIAAPLADSYSVIPRRVGQWTPLSPARLSTVSPLLPASSTSSILPSHATSGLSSRATTEDDVDVDDILAQWRRTHRSAAPQHASLSAARTNAVDSRPRTAMAAEAEDRAVNDAEQKQASVESAVDQVVNAVIKRLNEEKLVEQTRAPTDRPTEARATVTVSGVEETEPPDHNSPPPVARSTPSTLLPVPAPVLAPTSGSKWRDRKKSLSVQLPPRPNRNDYRPPLSAASNSVSASTLAPTVATLAASLKPQQTHWVAPTQPKPASEAQLPAAASVAVPQPVAATAAQAPIVSLPPRVVVPSSSSSSLLTGALSAVVSRALTCPAPSFASHVHSAMSASNLVRAASETSKQLRMEDLDDEPVSARGSDNGDEKRMEGKGVDEEAKVDEPLLATAPSEHSAASIEVEQSALVSTACPPAPLSTASASLPFTFTPASSVQQPYRTRASAVVSSLPALSASAVSHTSVPPAAATPSFASLSLSAASASAADAAQASSSLQPSVWLLPSSSSSQTSLQVQLAPNQPPSMPVFHLPTSMAALYAMASNSQQLPMPMPVFIPVVLSAAPSSSSAPVTTPLHASASVPARAASPSPPPPAASVSPPRPPAVSVAASPPVALLDLEVELAELLSSMHVSASLFANEPHLQTLVSRMRRMESVPTGT